MNLMLEVIDTKLKFNGKGEMIMSKFYTPTQVVDKVLDLGVECDIEHIYYLMHNDVLRSLDDYHITAESVNEYLKNQNIVD